MKRKILSIITLTAIVMTFFVPAASAAPVWKNEIGPVSANWSGVPKIDGKEYYYVTDEYHHSGNSALFINGYSGKTSDQFNMLQNIGTPDGSTYYLSFYAHEANVNNLSHPSRLYDAWNIQVRYSSGTGVAHINDSGWSKTKESGDWWHYEATYTPSPSDYNLHIIFNRGRDDIPVVIDDIELYKGDDRTTNLVKDGGFENYQKPELSIVNFDGYIKTYIKNPNAAVTSKSLSINGTTVDISAKTNNAEGTFGYSTQSTGPALANGGEYEVVYTATTAQGTSVIRDIAKPCVPTTLTPASPWRAVPASYYVTTEDSHSGNASLKVNGPNGGVSDRLNMIQNITHDTSSRYTLSFYVKSLYDFGFDGIWEYQVRLAEGSGVGHLNDSGWSTKKQYEGHGWYKYEATYVPTSDENLHIIINKNVDTRPILIDDIVITKEGSNTNLVKNGGFEEFLDIEPVFGVGTVNNDGSVTLTRKLSSIETGNIVAGLKIKNAAAGGVYPRVFVAMYDATENKLSRVNVLSPDRISAGASSTTLASEITVPDDGHDYDVKVMIWEHTDDIIGSSLWTPFELN